MTGERDCHLCVWVWLLIGFNCWWYIGLAPLVAATSSELNAKMLSNEYSESSQGLYSHLTSEYTNKSVNGPEVHKSKGHYWGELEDGWISRWDFDQILDFPVKSKTIQELSRKYKMLCANPVFSKKEQKYHMCKQLSHCMSCKWLPQRPYHPSLSCKLASTIRGPLIAVIDWNTNK